MSKLTSLPRDVLKTIANQVNTSSLNQSSKQISDTLEDYETKFFNNHLKSLFNLSDEYIKNLANSPEDDVQKELYKNDMNSLLKKIYEFMKTTDASIAGNAVIRTILKQKPSISKSKSILSMLENKNINNTIIFVIPFPEQVIDGIFETYEKSYKSDLGYKFTSTSIKRQSTNQNEICRNLEPSENLDALHSSSWIKSMLWQHFRKCNDEMNKISHSSWFINQSKIQVVRPEEMEEFAYLSSFLHLIVTLNINDYILYFMVLKRGVGKTDLVQAFPIIPTQFLLSIPNLQKTNFTKESKHEDFIKFMDVSSDKQTKAFKCLQDGAIMISEIALSNIHLLYMPKVYQQICKFNRILNWTINIDEIHKMNNVVIFSMDIWQKERLYCWIEFVKLMNYYLANKKILQSPINYKLLLATDFFPYGTQDYFKMKNLKSLTRIQIQDLKKLDQKTFFAMQKYIITVIFENIAGFFTDSPNPRMQHKFLVDYPVITQIYNMFNEKIQSLFNNDFLTSLNEYTFSYMIPSSLSVDDLYEDIANLQQEM
jgi:hypothetical protein